MAKYRPLPNYGPYCTLVNIVKRGFLISGDEPAQTFSTLYKNGYVRRRTIRSNFFVYSPTKKGLKYIRKVELNE